MPKFRDLFGRDSPKQRNLQDGLFQIASQTCNLLVQVNNTNNISFGDNATNILSNSVRDEDSPRREGFRKYEEENDQVVVLLPPRRGSLRGGKSRVGFPGGILKPKLSTVLESSPLGNEEDGEIWNHSVGLPANNSGSPIRRMTGRNGWCKPSCIPISIILLLIFLVVLLPLLDHGAEKVQISPRLLLPQNKCWQECSISLVETIPEGMFFDQTHKLHSSTYETWLNLIKSAERSIKILSTHWTLRQKAKYPDPSSADGEEIFAALLQVGVEKGVAISIAQNVPSRDRPNVDTEYLAKKRAATVRNLNFPRILGRGRSNLKLWIVDDVHFYLGSADFDWKAFTQTKELGLVGYNCSCVTEDLLKIFEMFWILSERDFTLPDQWMTEFSTKFNSTNPLDVTVDGNNNSYEIFFSVSPGQFQPPGREDDLTTILTIIEQTEKYLYISLMNYLPLSVFSPTTKYWPTIDDALKKAAIDHHVHIKVLVSAYNNSWTAQEYFLKALEDIAHSDSKVDIEVRRFIISGNSNQLRIPNARVSNVNFMVTESIAYLGSSGWTGDYFNDMSSMGFVVVDLENARNNRSLRGDLVEVFERDWNSKYSIPLDAVR